MIREIAAALGAAWVLAACAQKPALEVVTKPPPPKAVTKSRSEPVFYNGHNYLLKYDFDANKGLFDVRIAGTSKPLGPSDRKAAADIVSGSLRYFACPDGQTGRISGSPAFAAGTWQMQARCA